MSHRCSHLLLLTALLFATAVALVASPLPPNVVASTSPNGRFLILTQREFDSLDPDAVRRVVRTTYQVLDREPFLNAKDRLTAAVPFWSETASSWRIALDGADGRQLFWPLISDDGQTVVLVGITPGSFGQSVLRIYKKRQFTGTLVRAFMLADLWTPEHRSPDSMSIETDATPKWFSGGSLAFSPDSHFLLYHTQWSETLQIRLSDGQVTRAH